MLLERADVPGFGRPLNPKHSSPARTFSSNPRGEQVRSPHVHHPAANGVGSRADPLANSRAPASPSGGRADDPGMSTIGLKIDMVLTTRAPPGRPVLGYHPRGAPRPPNPARGGRPVISGQGRASLLSARPEAGIGPDGRNLAMRRLTK